MRWPALLMLVLFACHREKPKPPPKLVQTTTPNALRPRGPEAADFKAIVTPKAVDVHGIKRDYLLITPPAPPPGPLPLVLVLHGDGGGMKSLHDAWPFERATQNSAYVAYLEGLEATWDLETLNANRDVAYAEAVINDIAAQVPIDRTHVFAAGYSSGAFFANVLACHRPGLLRGIAANAGGAPYNQAEKWANGYPKCPGQKPTAALVLHGDQDFTVTPDSGRFNAEYWAFVNGCNDSEVETTAYPECRVYRGCPPGKSVGYCTIPPLGHWVWDQSAAATWTFFKRQ